MKPTQPTLILINEKNYNTFKFNSNPVFNVYFVFLW